MISIVVCSKDKRLYDKLTGNITATIGVPFELIRIDNTNNEYGICSAYNYGAAASQYGIICFVHEDVLFTIAGWGDHVCNHLHDKTIGAIGVAGASYKTSVPSSWSFAKDFRAIHLTQFFKNKRKRKKVFNKSPAGAASYPVIVLDGVFIAVKKSVWQAYPFDEKYLTGFHGYDIDFTFGISRFTTLQVVNDIGIEHYSEGKPNKSWLEAAMHFSSKWGDELPAGASTIEVSAATEWQLYAAALTSFYKKLKKFDYSRFQIVRKMMKYGILKSQPEKSHKLIVKLLRRFI